MILWWMLAFFWLMGAQYAFTITWSDVYLRRKKALWKHLLAAAIWPWFFFLAFLEVYL